MNLSEIQDIIDRQIVHHDREEAEKKLNDCVNAIGAITKLKAQAFGELERAKAKTMNRHPDLNYRMLKLKIDAQTIDEQEAYMLADRLSVSLFKVIDGLKALLSIQAEDAPSWSR